MGNEEALKELDHYLTTVDPVFSWVRAAIEAQVYPVLQKHRADESHEDTIAGHYVKMVIGHLQRDARLFGTGVEAMFETTQIEWARHVGASLMVITDFIAALRLRSMGIPIEHVSLVLGKAYYNYFTSKDWFGNQT